MRLVGTASQSYIVDDIKPMVARYSSPGSCSENTTTPLADRGLENHEDHLEELEVAITRVSQSCLLARDFPRELLLVIFSFALWRPSHEHDDDDPALLNLDPCFPLGLVEEPASPRHGLPLLAASVCAYWRFVCLTTPTLWSSLHFDVKDPLPTHIPQPTRKVRRRRLRTSVCNLFLARSHPALLSLVLDTEPVSDWYIDGRLAMAQIILACVKHRRSWKSLEIKDLNDKHHFALVFDNSTDVSTNPSHFDSGSREPLSPFLKTLILHFQTTTDIDPFSNNIPRSLCFAIPLSSILNFVSQISYKFPNVLHVEFTFFELEMAYIPRILSAFSALFPRAPPKHISSSLEPLFEAAHDKYESWYLGMVSSVDYHGFGTLWVCIKKEKDGVGLQSADARVTRRFRRCFV